MPKNKKRVIGPRLTTYDSAVIRASEAFVDDCIRIARGFTIRDKRLHDLVVAVITRRGTCVRFVPVTPILERCACGMRLAEHSQASIAKWHEYVGRQIAKEQALLNMSTRAKRQLMEDACATV